MKAHTFPVNTALRPIRIDAIYNAKRNVTYEVVKLLAISGPYKGSPLNAFYAAECRRRNFLCVYKGETFISHIDEYVNDDTYDSKMFVMEPKTKKLIRVIELEECYCISSVNSND